MKKNLSFLLLCVCALSFGQQNKKISMIDYVEVLNKNKAEAFFYYQNNWGELRIKAIEKGYIDS